MTRDQIQECLRTKVASRKILDRDGCLWEEVERKTTSRMAGDPVIDSIRADVDRLTHSTNFLIFLEQRALIMQEELPAPSDEDVDDQRYHFMSLLLNLANTFLYMVNTYFIVPTTDDYCMNLGAAPTVCGIVIGAMAVAQVFSSVYFRPLVFSSIVLLVAYMMYVCDLKDYVL